MVLLIVLCIQSCYWYNAESWMKDTHTLWSWRTLQIWTHFIFFMFLFLFLFFELTLELKRIICIDEYFLNAIKFNTKFEYFHKNALLLSYNKQSKRYCLKLFTFLYFWLVVDGTPLPSFIFLLGFLMSTEVLSSS